MSIKTEIERIGANVAAAYTALSAKGGALPLAQTSANLASAIDSIPAGWSNPNLLINSDCASLVNQKNQNEYTNSGYTFDMWYNRGCDSVAKADDCMVFISSKSKTGFNQRLEVPEDIIGKTITASILIEENTSPSARFGLHLADTVSTHPDIAVAKEIGGETGLISVTGKVESLKTFTGINFGCFIREPGMLKIRAMKLELGPVQTLAHKEGDTWVLNDPPPNKALELAKCQYYQVVYDTNGMIGRAHAHLENKAYFSTMLPSNMRACPTVRFEDAELYVITGAYSNNGYKIKGTTNQFLTGNCLTCYAEVEGTLTVGKDYNAYLTNGKLIIDANL